MRLILNHDQIFQRTCSIYFLYKYEEILYTATYKSVGRSTKKKNCYTRSPQIPHPTQYNKYINTCSYIIKKEGDIVIHIPLLLHHLQTKY
jgi:hypothetical protein